MNLPDLLKAAGAAGVAHNHGRGGEFVLCGTEAQLLAFADRIGGITTREASFVPGVMRCAKCKFQLQRITLAVNLGTTCAGDNKTEPCPNGCGPLWPTTWEQEARDCWKTLEAMHEQLAAAKRSAA